MTNHEIATFGEPFFDSHCVIGEAPIYRSSDDTLHYVNPLADPPEIHILSLATKQLRILPLADAITVTSFRKGRPGYIAAGTLGFAFIDEETGALENFVQVLSEAVRGKLRFNDGASDSRGRFWAGTMDHEAIGLPLGGTTPGGNLYRCDPDGTVTQHASGLYCSNGIAWSADNKWMYHNDSYGLVTRRYAFDEEQGTLSAPSVFLDFRPDADSISVEEKHQGGEPDGMVLDAEGNIWIGIWGKGCVLCYSPEGRLLREVVAEGVPYVTCPGWAGDDLGLLVCTTGTRHGVGGPDGGKPFMLDVGKKWGVKGVEKFRFAG
ncbi:hypothetical protein BDZ89DRAFT_1064495 [Hymenopellis radicata]|nr:hypothetical protein BDZ89DRAFT_1064495 [Hymenopellis radicata]